MHFAISTEKQASNKEPRLPTFCERKHLTHSLIRRPELANIPNSCPCRYECNVRVICIGILSQLSYGKKFSKQSIRMTLTSRVCGVQAAIVRSIHFSKEDFLLQNVCGVRAMHAHMHNGRQTCDWITEIAPCLWLCVWLVCSVVLHHGVFSSGCGQHVDNANAVLEHSHGK